MLDGVYREGDLRFRYRITGRIRFYRKRYCGYWDFEQSELSYTDYEEAKESGKDYLYYGSVIYGREGYRNLENIDDGNLSFGIENNSFKGSLDVIWKGGGYREVNGFIDFKNLNYSFEDSEGIEEWIGCRNLDDFLGNFG